MSLPASLSIDQFKSVYSIASGDFPRVLSIVNASNSYQIDLEITGDLNGFRGHFPGNPVLPGIVQLHWAATFTSQLFGIQGPPMEIKQLKFKNVVQPPATLSLKLLYISNTKVNFEFSSMDHSNSSGSMCYLQKLI